MKLPDTSSPNLNPARTVLQIKDPANLPAIAALQKGTNLCIYCALTLLTEHYQESQHCKYCPAHRCVKESSMALSFPDQEHNKLLYMSLLLKGNTKVFSVNIQKHILPDTFIYVPFAGRAMC